MWVGLKTTSSTFSVDWNFTRFDSLETAAVVTMTTMTATTGGNELNSILVCDTWAHVIKVSHQNPRMRQKKLLIKTHNTLTILWHKLNLQHSVLVHCFQTVCTGKVLRRNNGFKLGREKVVNIRHAFRVSIHILYRDVCANKSQLFHHQS